MNSNQLGVAGIGCVVIAVGELAGWWWSLLAAGILLIALAYVAHRWEQTSIVDETLEDLERRFHDAVRNYKPTAVP